MAIRKGTVEAVSTKYEKYSCLVDGEWYRTKLEWATVKPNKGDVIEFDDKGGKFLAKVKIIEGSGGSASSPSSGGKVDFNLGVELGHASNIAVRVLAQMAAHDGAPQPGSKDYYAEFVKQTETVYEIMRGLKNKYSGKPIRTPEPGPAVEEAKVEVEEVTEDDLF